MTQNDPQAPDLQFRFASVADVSALAMLNLQLLRDEGNAHSLSLPELQARMVGWLSDKDYRAVLFESGGHLIGYALFVLAPDHVFLRQFYVSPEYRRNGIGRAAMAWLWANPWRKSGRLQLEVLSHNAAALAFWRAVGLSDHYIAMQMIKP